MGPRSSYLRHRHRRLISLPRQVSSAPGQCRKPCWWSHRRHRQLAVLNHCRLLPSCSCLRQMQSDCLFLVTQATATLAKGLLSHSSTRLELHLRCNSHTSISHNSSNQNSSYTSSRHDRHSSQSYCSGRQHQPHQVRSYRHGSHPMGAICLHPRVCLTSNCHSNRLGGITCRSRTAATPSPPGRNCNRLGYSSRRTMWLPTLGAIRARLPSST